MGKSAGYWTARTKLVQLVAREVLHQSVEGAEKGRVPMHPAEPYEGLQKAQAWMADPGSSSPMTACQVQALPEPQWIKCDVRNFDMSVLGQYGVIMTDPPWEIHQDLPYGTMGDHEMRHLNVGVLQDEGVIFVWVTGACLPSLFAGFLVISPSTSWGRRQEGHKEALAAPLACRCSETSSRPMLGLCCRA